MDNKREYRLLNDILFYPISKNKNLFTTENTKHQFFALYCYKPDNALVLLSIYQNICLL